MEQLNKCQAWYGPIDEMRIAGVVVNGEVIPVEYGEYLKSYSSIVAIRDGETGCIYWLPRFNYSNTTVQHRYKWLRKRGYMGDKNKMADAFVLGACVGGVKQTY